MADYWKRFLSPRIVSYYPKWWACCIKAWGQCHRRIGTALSAEIHLSTVNPLCMCRQTWPGQITIRRLQGRPQASLWSGMKLRWVEASFLHSQQQIVVFKVAGHSAFSRKYSKSIAHTWPSGCLFLGICYWQDFLYNTSIHWKECGCCIFFKMTLLDCTPTQLAQLTTCLLSNQQCQAGNAQHGVHEPVYFHSDVLNLFSPQREHDWMLVGKEDFFK